MNRAATAAYDVLVVGGGVNGAGIARDAAGRGLRVLLCEQDDLASHTSSASTKLIHGGLRYLEHYDFMLVRKALLEREVLLAAAPHIIWPMRFVMPHDTHLRPEWIIRVGLFLYDNLAQRRYLPDSEGVDLARHAAGPALDARFRRGFVYSDAWVDDARLVALNAVDAAERGAEVLTRTRFASARRAADAWTVRLEHGAPGGRARTVAARAIVNAAGPWVGQVLDAAIEAPAKHTVRLVKGSHVIVPRIFEHEFAYIFQNPDGRIIFAIPYEREFTLIGTTDLEFDGDPARVRISPDEVRYLCAMASRYFRRPINPASVCASYSGVRPLLDDASGDPSAVTRDYSLELDRDGAPLLSVFGGKITTYRRLAEEAVNRLAPLLGCRRRGWTRRARLPGGDIPRANFAKFSREVDARYPWLPDSTRRRYARAYGTRIARLVGDARRTADLGEEIAQGLYAAEVDYLRRHEFARTAEDILRRRSKLGLHLPPGAARDVDRWIERHPLVTTRETHR
jgi:glycerol-3-phosphate dehydrogenase